MYNKMSLINDIEKLMNFRFIVVFLLLSACRVTPPRPLVGPLALNNLLDKSERLYEGRLTGAECLRSRDGKEIFASLVNEIVKINGQHITHVAKFGKPCGKLFCVFTNRDLKCEGFGKTKSLLNKNFCFYTSIE